MSTNPFLNILKPKLTPTNKSVASSLQAPTPQPIQTPQVNPFISILKNTATNLASKTIAPRNVEAPSAFTDTKTSAKNVFADILKLGNNVIEGVKNPVARLNTVFPNAPLVNKAQDGTFKLDPVQAEKTLNATMGMVGGADFVASKLGGGKIPSAVLRTLSKEKNPSVISYQLQRVYKIERTVADDLASQLAPTRTVGEVKAVLGGYKGPNQFKQILAPVQEEKILKELNALDTSPVKVNGKLSFGNVDTEFRLLQLQEKLRVKPLTKAEVTEADTLLKQVGVDASKPVQVAPKAPAVNLSKSLNDTLANPPSSMAITSRRVPIRSVSGKFAGSTSVKSSLAQEARKYKSAGKGLEEFEMRETRGLFHATDNFSAESINKNGFTLGNESVSKLGAKDKMLGDGIYFGKSRSAVSQYGDSVIEVRIPKNLKIKDISNEELLKAYQDNGWQITKTDPAEISNYFKKLGYDGLRTPRETVIFDPKNIKTKSQLTDIWDKSKGNMLLRRPFFNKDIQLSTTQIKKAILDDIAKSGYTSKDLAIIFDTKKILGNADGSFQVTKYGQNIVTIVEKKGKAGLVTALHETKHFLFSKLSPEIQKEALAIAKKEMGPLYKTMLAKIYKAEGAYAGANRENKLLEEYVVDKWAKADAGYKKSVYAKVFEALDNLLKKIQDIYKSAVKRFKEIPNKQSGHIDFGGDLRNPKPEVKNLFKAKIIPNPGNKLLPVQVEYKAYGSTVHRNFASEAQATEWIAEREKALADSVGIEPGTQAIKSEISKKVSEVDRLIAEGKIRVVSRDGRDVYQVKKAGEWVNTRDEDSAIKQVTTVKPTTEKQDKIAYLNEAIADTKQEIKDHPGKILQRFASKKEGQFLDFKNPELAKTDAEKRAIIARNTKLTKVSENTLGGDKFDNPDEIRAQIEDYNAKKELLESYQVQKKSIKISAEGIPLSTAKAKPVIAKKVIVKTSPINTSTGEGRSIEIAARQAQDILRGEQVPPGVSLPRIIEQTVTPVQKKVHTIDTFLRTPHFVKEKIGFGKEATELRTAMDSYWKELPKNIDKVTQWSKQVSKESNERIFRWLDGEAIDLTPIEMKVGGEIKTYLKEWATRLGLEKDNTITHYITHIFDKELLAKEFDEDLAKILADRIPGSVYDPFLLKRLGAKGYKQDTWAALDAYVKRATRKVHMDPVLEKIQAKTGPTLDMSNIEESQFNYIKKYIDNINMRPSNADKGIDNFIKSKIGYKLGQRPLNAVLATFRRMTFRGMLGLNPASAIRNLSQGINTYAELGEKYTVIGYASLFKKGAREELAREGILNAGFIQDRVLSSTKKAIEKMDKGLFVFFNLAEHINRGSAYFGAKAKGLKKGMTEQEAIEFAKGIVRKTQFVFDSIDTPVGLSSDIAKTFSQFGTFGIKQVEFLGGKAKGAFYGQEKAKNIAGLMRYAVAGIAFVYTIGSAIGMKPEELIPFMGTLEKGKLPFTEPPSLKFPIEVTKAALNTPDKYGQVRSGAQKLKDIGKSAVGLIPAGSQIRKTLQGLQAVKEGGSYTKSGNLQFTQGTSLGAKAQSVIFGKYASPEAQNYFNKVEINSKETSAIKPVYDQVQALDAEGKGEEAQAIVDGLTDAQYEVYKKYRTAEKTKQTIQGKKDMVATYKEIQAMTDEEAQPVLDAMTDDEYKYYKLVKEDFKKLEKAKEGEKPEFGTGPQTETNVIKTVFTYAKAIGSDPVTAFNRIFSGQRIRRVDNGAIIVDRMTFPESTKVKEERGATANMKLDHTIPLQLGGSNDLDNLKLVDTVLWTSYTPVENFLGQKLRNKEITKKEAQDLITRFKNGELSADEILN